MSDEHTDLHEILDEERADWSKQFGGGMLPFDNAYWLAERHPMCTVAEAQRAGATALLDAFTARLHARFNEAKGER